MFFLIWLSSLYFQHWDNGRYTYAIKYRLWRLHFSGGCFRWEKLVEIIPFGRVQKKSSKKFIVLTGERLLPVSWLDRFKSNQLLWKSSNDQFACRLFFDMTFVVLKKKRLLSVSRLEVYTSMIPILEVKFVGNVQQAVVVQSTEHHFRGVWIHSVASNFHSVGLH